MIARKVALILLIVVIACAGVYYLFQTAVARKRQEVNPTPLTDSRNVLSSDSVPNKIIGLFFFLSSLYFIYEFVFSVSWRVLNHQYQGGAFFDFKWYYAAGIALVRGISPYQPEPFVNILVEVSQMSEKVAVPFVYPANIVPFILPLGYLSYQKAFILWLISGFICLNVFILGLIILFKQFYPNTSKMQIATIAIGSSLIYGTTFSFKNGNISLFIATLLLWSIVLARLNRNILAGVLLGLAAIKPTISLLAIAYFVLKGRWKLVSSCFLTILVTSGLGLLFCGHSPIEFFSLYKAGYKLWIENYFNAPSKAPRRLDLGVLLFRILGNNFAAVQRLLSSILCYAPIIYIYSKFWLQRGRNKGTKSIDLGEIALVVCLGLSAAYSQPANAIVLCFVFLFLFLYLSANITAWETKKTTTFYLWVLALICLTFHSQFSYAFLDPRWSASLLRESASLKNALRQSVSIAISLLPNLSILGLILCLNSLAIPGAKNSSGEQKIDNSSLASVPNDLKSR